MPERPTRHKPFCASTAKKHNSVDRRKSAARRGYVKAADTIREAFVCPVTCPVPLGVHMTATAPVQMAEHDGGRLLADFGD